MLKQAFINLVIFYQKYISPGLPKNCRYYPTCSAYMIEAVQKHGLVSGFLMGMARIIRCNPFNKGGLDPVPEKFTILRNKHLKKSEYEQLVREIYTQSKGN